MTPPLPAHDSSEPLEVDVPSAGVPELVEMGAVMTTMASLSMPDLVISDLAITSFVDGQATYTYTITNIGDGPANLDGPTADDADNVAIQGFASADEIFHNAGDIPVGGSIIGISHLGILMPGESISGSFGAGGNFDPSTHPYLTVKADWGEVVTESNEANNTAAVLFEQPDLVVTDLTIDSYNQGLINYTFTITNVGTGPADLDGPTTANTDNVSTQAFLSEDQIFNNGNDVPAGGGILDLSPLGTLEPGESFTRSTGGVNLTFDASTRPYLTLKADWGDVVDESNEDNNTASVFVATPGDTNSDGIVDVLTDAFTLAGNLGIANGATWANGDFNGDGRVDVLNDAFTLVENLGTDRRPPTALRVSNTDGHANDLFEVPSTVLMQSTFSTEDDRAPAINSQIELGSSGRETLALSGSYYLVDSVFAAVDW